MVGDVSTALMIMRMSPILKGQDFLKLEKLKMKKQVDRTHIYNAIYDLVRLVPVGRVTSYGAVAAAVGLKSGARMVGYALSLSGKELPEVPAHRVVNRNGQLSGRHHFNPPEKMQLMLEKEGVNVENDEVVSFKDLFWDPLKELDL